MESFIKYDIFFFTTFVVVVMIASLIIIALWQVVRILKNLRDVSKMVKTGSEDVYGDLSTIRLRVKRFLKFIPGIHKKKNKN